MKGGHVAFLLAGILFALGGTLSFFPSSGHRSNDVMQVGSGAVSAFEGVAGVDLQRLEARGRRGSRTSRKRPARPARKRPARKKKSPKKATKKHTKKPTKKPATSKTACKYTPKPKAGTAGSKKLHARVTDPDPCREPDENDRIMKENYQIALKAAKKKRKTLKVNHMYLFVMTQGMRLAKHHAVIAGKVMKLRDGQIGMEATMQQLGKSRDVQGKTVRHQNAKVFCGSAVGGECYTGPYRRVECGKLQAKFKLAGDMDVEFANPESFIQKGNDVFMSEKPYNVLTWNCQIYAKNLINVTKLKPGEIVELTDEQAQPSSPLSDSDSEIEWGVNGGLGGLVDFQVVNADPLPFDEETNNGARFEID